MKKLCRKDGGCMAVLTLLSGIFLFFRLGNMQAPETSIQMEYGNNQEIVLDMGEDVFVESLNLFLGHQIDRTVAISYYDEEEEEWVLISESEEIEDVYAWNRIMVEKEIRWLGIVSRNEEAEVKELVVLGEDGEILLPVNYGEYQKIFDEQDLYPGNDTYYYGTMFDEVYYASSAYQLLNGINMMEYTHPPMGKILMAIGVKLFGVTPFGWRCVCALFGMLMTPVMYLLVHRLTGRTKYAVFGTLLLNLDFMHYTLSRIGTLDSIVAFFILLMFTVMYYHLTQMDEKLQTERPVSDRKELLHILTGAFASGMGIATKWTGIYAFFGIFVIFLSFYLYQMKKYKECPDKKRYLKSRFFRSLLCYGITAPVIYMLSFIPIAITRGDNFFEVFLDNNLYMLFFHSDIVFEHPYESPWYTWPLDLVPLVDTGTILEGNEKVQLVVTFGNPAIWWAGLLALFFLLYRAIMKKDRKALYLVAAYMFMLVPWMFVKRTVFIYQYYSCAIILCAVLAYSVNILQKKYKHLYGIMLELALVCMIIFYPVISGFPVYGETILRFMQWFDTWKWI